MGVEPGTARRVVASLVLSQGGRPVAYRAVCVVSTQSRSRTCKHSGLSRAALPVGVSGHIEPKWSRMELNHRFLDVSQASLPLDHGTEWRIKIRVKHAPKDLNPDQLGWNQPCCHYTRGVCFQRKP